MKSQIGVKIWEDIENMLAIVVGEHSYVPYGRIMFLTVQSYYLVVSFTVWWFPSISSSKCLVSIVMLITAAFFQILTSSYITSRV
jgi:hypothetical protein